VGPAIRRGFSQGNGRGNRQGADANVKCSISWKAMIAIDHNHVALEHHGESELWVFKLITSGLAAL
jgi:hypothetical protein